MSPRLAVAAAVLLMAAAQFACAPKDPKDASFSGVWLLVSENGIANSKEERTVSVAADKGRFRIFSKSPLSEITEAFDGQTLYQKTAYPLGPGPSDEGQSPEGAAPAAAGASHAYARESKPGPAQLAQMRFWVRPALGKGSSGGQIAGRETVLHQAREKRPDGEITAQVWTDAETGVALKYVMTIYSSQVGSMVSKTTEECREIRFGPVEESSFSKP